MASAICHALGIEDDQAGGEHSFLQGPLTVLSRSNARLFSIAHKCVGTRPGARLAFVGGLETLKLGLVLDTYHLRTGQFIEIRDAYVRGFARNGEDAFATLKRTAELTDDVELNSRCAMVDDLVKSGIDVPSVVQNIQKACVPMESTPGAHLILSTAHRAKGLEFDRVLLCDDFQKVSQVQKIDDDGGGQYSAVKSPPGEMRWRFTSPDGMQYETVQVDEVNLVYVACTRAKTQLILNQDLSRLLDKSWHPSILDCASLEALPYLEARWLPRALLRTCDPTQDLAPHLSNVCTICNRTSSFKQSTLQNEWSGVPRGEFCLFGGFQTQQTLEVSSTPFMCVLHGGCVSSLDTGYGSCARNAQWEEVLCASCAVSNVQLQLGIAAPHWWHIPIANNKHSLGTIPFIISVCADLVVPNTVPDAFLRPRDDSADWGDITG